MGKSQLGDGAETPPTPTKRAPRGAQRLLTVREVMNAREGMHSDGDGLRMVVRPDGAAWVLRYTSPTGKRREMGLGAAKRGTAKDAGESLSAARKQAELARAVLARGEDPIEYRNTSVETKRAQEAGAKLAKTTEALTLARATRAYHERVIEPSRSDKHAAQWIASLENHVGKSLWHAPLSSIEPAALLDRLLEVNAQIPETASRIRQRLDAVFDDAIVRGLVSTNPAKPLVRALRDADGGRKSEGFRSLPFVKVPAFYRTVAAQDGVAARALQFLLLTASRTDEVLSAEWAEFDLAARVWTVPAARMKASEEHVVDLTDAAVAIVEGQKVRPTVDKRFVFASPMMSGAPVSNMAMLVLLDRIGMRKDTTVHGLRSSFSTWAYESGKYRPDVIEAALAHREKDRIKAAYNRAKFTAERHELLHDWTKFVMGPQ